MGAINLRDFPDDLHVRLKVQAAKEKTNIKALIIRLVAEYLEEREKGG